MNERARAGAQRPQPSLLVAVLLTVVLASCTQAGPPDIHVMPDDPDCTSPTAATGEVQASFEEANPLGTAGSVPLTGCPEWLYSYV